MCACADRCPLGRQALVWADSSHAWIAECAGFLFDYKFVAVQWVATARKECCDLYDCAICGRWRPPPSLWCHRWNATFARGAPSPAAQPRKPCGNGSAPDPANMRLGLIRTYCRELRDGRARLHAAGGVESLG